MDMDGSGGSHAHREGESLPVSRRDEAITARLALASLDHLAASTFIVAPDGLLRHCNEAARRMLARGTIVRTQGPRLVFVAREAGRIFESAMQQCIGERRTSLATLSGADGETAELSVSPLGHDSDAGGDEALALVCITRLLPDPREISRRVQRRYGVTRAEARVMASIAAGATVEEAALAHGVRPSTVRAQIRSLFVKTGVSRQTDLVRLALVGTPVRTDTMPVRDDGQP